MIGMWSPFTDLNSDMLGPGGLFGWILLCVLASIVWACVSWLYRAFTGKIK